MILNTEIRDAHKGLIQIFMQANEINSAVVTTHFKKRGKIELPMIRIETLNSDDDQSLSFLSIRHAGIENMLVDFLLKCKAPDVYHPLISIPDEIVDDVSYFMSKIHTDHSVMPIKTEKREVIDYSEISSWIDTDASADRFQEFINLLDLIKVPVNIRISYRGLNTEEYTKAYKKNYLSIENSPESLEKINELIEQFGSVDKAVQSYLQNRRYL